jgi:transcriptional regulator with XRE-family HTH domain
VHWSARLGAHLEASRTQAGLRRVDLAQRLGVSEESIRLWERGAVQPSEEHLVRLIPMLSIESSFWQSQEVASTAADEEPELARRLREERAERSLTQAALSAELGVPQATYAGWETGRTTPSPEHFAILAALLGLSEERIEAICSSPLEVDYAEWPAFGQLVGARRQALRLTRADLAEALGVSARAVMSWELGYRRPQPAQITALATVLAVHPAELVAALPPRSAPSRLGALILSRQRELGLLSTDVARLVGTTEPTVSRWINGHSRPGPKNLERLARVLDLPRALVIDAAGRAA